MAAESKRQSSIILRVILVLFAFGMIFYLGSMIKEYSSTANDKASVIAKREEKQLELNELSDMLENGNDKDFIERAAREKLGYVYRDEHKYIDISGN